MSRMMYGNTLLTTIMATHGPSLNSNPPGNNAFGLIWLSLISVIIVLVIVIILLVFFIRKKRREVDSNMFSVGKVTKPILKDPAFDTASNSVLKTSFNPELATSPNACYGFVPVSSINNSNQMYDEVSHVKENENNINKDPALQTSHNINGTPNQVYDEIPH